TVSGPGHHSVIDSPDGKELFIVYHTHQQPSNPSFARQLAIDRMEFVDSSGGETKIVVKGPTDTPQPMPSGAGPIVRGQSDEFDQPDGSDIDRERWTVFGERPDHWKIERGALRVTAQSGDAREMHNDLKNLFLTEPPATGDFAVTTHVHFHPEHDGDQAFICLWQNHNNFIRLSLMRDSDGEKFQVAFEHDAQF